MARSFTASVAALAFVAGCATTNAYDRFIVAMAEAQCRAFYSCCPAPSAQRFLRVKDRATCAEESVKLDENRELSKIIRGKLKAGVVRFDPKNAAACLEMIPRDWCDADPRALLATSGVCARAVLGRVPVGKQCNFYTDCENCYCEAKTRLCAERLGVGAECGGRGAAEWLFAGDGPCAAGLECNAEGRCAPLRPLGAQCTDLRDCASSTCEDGVCVRSSASMRKECNRE